jgi:2-C-methyl-D-erythritol 2,4-cyclodiphosphate synthase
MEECDAMRVGIGFDIHRFGAKRPLRLGGVEVLKSKGLIGHSDADVVLHAVCDALLGAAGLDDIGEHFPDTDPALRGADSADLLGRVATMVARAGFVVVNVDCTVMAERPRLAPFRGPMRQRIAGLLGLPAGAVSVKFTTLEKLGALGRAEGIAAEAVCLLEERH